MTSTMLQHTAENVPKGIIPLENVRVRAVDERDGEHAEFVPVTIEDNFLSFSHNTQQNLMASLLSSKEDFLLSHNIRKAMGFRDLQRHG